MTTHTLHNEWKQLLEGYVGQFMSEKRMTTRLHGEEEARVLLNERLGNFSGEDIKTFLAMLSKDFSNNNESHDRFMPGLYGSNAKKIAHSIDAFNHWSKQLWTASEEQLPALLDTFWTKNEILGSGTSLPTAILYLREPETYSIWVPTLEEGLKTIFPSLEIKRRTTAGYTAYNEALQSIRSQLSIPPQTMDVILTKVVKNNTPEKVPDFKSLFSNFLDDLFDSEEGQEHVKRYSELREEARTNYNHILQMEEHGEDTTDIILLKLLPYGETKNNRAKGAWVHIAPAVTKDIKQWFEAANWAKPSDWPDVSKTILSFVKNCIAEPEKIAAHCQSFQNNVPSKGLQMGMLSPILNALAPDSFSLINTKSRITLNYLCNTNYHNKLQSYPELNKLHFEFVAGQKELLTDIGQKAILPSDIFDMFCHWLVAIKKFSFNSSKIYKIAPGRNAENWEACRDEGYISIGWNELGDVSGIQREEFDKRRDAACEKYDGWTKSGAGQVWKFSRIKEGDRIIANSGKTKILSFGTVSGPYYFVANTEYGHRLPVTWDDQTPRKVNEPSWAGTIQTISPERFEHLREAEEYPSDSDSQRQQATSPTNPEYSIKQCSDDTGFDTEQIELWLKALDRKRQGVFYGPPGTGKTFLAKKLAKHLIGESDGFVQTIQFHPEYAYQDFIQGIRPVTTKDGGIKYDNVPGVFKRFCSKAEDCKGPCVLIIDEINRANLSQVFGELMYLLEYRNKSVELSGSGVFRIPEKVRIIGTMNTADRSIALVDYALRRRFAFLRLAPNYEILEKTHSETSFDVSGLISVIKEINLDIDDSHYEIGISFFLVDNLEFEIEDIWHTEIEPYLEEYFFDCIAKAEKYSWHKVSDRIL